MSAKHTPGPWAVGNTDPLMFGAKRGNGTEPIGFVYGPSNPENSKVGMRALADARLVAAAPEMLAALQSIAEYWNRDHNETAMADACWHAIETALAAIAKATGEPQ